MGARVFGARAAPGPRRLGEMLSCLIVLSVFPSRARYAEE